MGPGPFDPEGNALTYLWSILDAPTGSAASFFDPSDPAPTFLTDLEGTYIIQLVVNDGALDSPPDTLNVYAEAPPSGNTAPVANAGPDQTPFVDDVVVLDGSGSSDVDGDPLTSRGRSRAGPRVAPPPSPTPRWRTPASPWTRTAPMWCGSLSTTVR